MFEFMPDEFTTRTIKLRRQQARCNKRKRMNDRKSLIAKLGGVCVRCGFSDPRALCIDHVNGGGGKERKLFGGNRHRYYKMISDTADSGAYQILCANCNSIKRIEDSEYVT